MAAFEFGNFPLGKAPGAPEAAVENASAAPQALDAGRPREESIIAMKIYDSCRHRNCLTHKDIGPARASAPTVLDCVEIKETDVIIPPASASTAVAEDLKVSTIRVLSKRPSQFKAGYWVVELRYIFDYNLCFRRSDNSVIGSVPARNHFDKRVTLFGSIGTDVTISTDLFVGPGGNPLTMGSDPNIMIEAKAVALAADIRRPHCKHSGESVAPPHVNITIGLFGIVKLYRIVSLLVESRGFSIAPPCQNIIPPDACQFFDTIDFPMDVFTPPRKQEFQTGASENIPGMTVADFDFARDEEE